MNMNQNLAKDAAAALDEKRMGAAETRPEQNKGREGMRQWMAKMQENAYLTDPDIVHTFRYWLGDEYEELHPELVSFGAQVPAELEPAVMENDLRFNNPRVEHFNGIGDRDDRIIHHPKYNEAGNIIYGSGMIKRLGTLCGLKEGMAFFLLSSYAGEAGHNCPIACTFETVRLLRYVDDFPERQHWIDMLEVPSYDDNFTSSQFLTEVQGGSDVGKNATKAWKDSDGNWRIRGEKWFCSNANAELMVITARHSEELKGTKGLSVFIVPARKPDGSKNDFTFRRLKEKMGTKALASSEIDFHDAYAVPAGSVERGFNRMMEQVVHFSRISLAISVLGMNERAYQTARNYADTREAFGNTIIDYPLVQENLAGIKTDVTVGLAGMYALLAGQDDADTGKEMPDYMHAFLRLMTNISKSIISKRVVDNVHHSIDTLGGNGAIETQSSLPRLLRDSVIYENWEGTHNTLIVQVQRDIARYAHDEAYFKAMEDYLAMLPASVASKKEKAESYLAVLKKDVEACKSSSAALQSMKLKKLIERMADISYYVITLLEAADQKENGLGESKFAAAEYHRLNRLETSDIEWNEETLTLIKAVVSA